MGNNHAIGSNAVLMVLRSSGEKESSMDGQLILQGQEKRDWTEDLNHFVDRMIATYDDGFYPAITVKRHWSTYNPTLSGELARPGDYRWYLLRELEKLLKRGAEIRLSAARERLDLSDRELLGRIDESSWDITRKKLFLFTPERIELSMNRLEHYTGTRCDDFQRHILLTNYEMYMQLFKETFQEAKVSDRDGVQMPTAHQVLPDNRGMTIINIGVGPSNAKTLTDHLAVLRPDAMIMVGHCGGVRNHQEIGDYVLASGYMRADSVLDDHLPLGVPLTPTFMLNRYLAMAMEEMKKTYRVGTVYTTADRNWELSVAKTAESLRQCRAVAIDMESATVAANGFRYRIPNATLLCVSDKPLHGKPKLKGASLDFYQQSKQDHLKLAMLAIQNALKDWPQGLPNQAVRGPDEPLMGGPEDGVTRMWS